ncbi:uncharacterized protein At2g29880 [Ricinus communis]|uniref:Myb/SANT-like domain-containing protein n=1 Tax=Ricinus communis TaxID=3988 RepID=B9R8P5_RICCO|nr:uncharacterized protein At2g29880 [Ricinus communis]XP_025013523.2 uncharacterized protein At2g29880 [Ricinus communis]XP_025013524.1 uncharacterized protein At2g29880 [Ricinus communis]EEF52875.1 conserved hypothetical protein [Ricinus communis]|eukprot:XP_002510688.1 uncharacterized protein At2g29880 isoform X2 [Ricinus communis]
MGTKSKKTNVVKRDVFKWTERMDDAFIDALVRQQRLGNRVDNVFTTAAYDNMLKELREKIGMPFQKDHLKNRLKSLKNNFKECFDLFNGVSGFAWTPETKMFSGKPEAWKAFVKAKPEAKKWMTTQIAHYDKLVFLFAKDRSKSNGDKIAKQKAGQLAVASGSGHFFDITDRQNELTLNLDLEDLNEINDGTSQLATPVEANSQADSQAHSHSETSSKGQKRKAPKDDIFEREFKSIREAIKDVAEAIREGNIIAERGRLRVYSEQEVFTELVKIGVERHMRYKAYTFLIANAGRARAFFGCPSEERKEFLLQMMYSPEDS